MDENSKRMPLLNVIDEGIPLDKRDNTNERRLVEDEMDKPMGELDINTPLTEEKMPLNNNKDDVVLDKTDEGKQNSENNIQMSLYEKHMDISLKNDGACLDENDTDMSLNKSKISILMPEIIGGVSLDKKNLSVPKGHMNNFALPSDINVIDMPGDSKGKLDDRSQVDDDDDDSVAPESTECSQDEYSDDVDSSDYGVTSRTVDVSFVKRNDNRNSGSCINNIENSSKYSKNKVLDDCDKSKLQDVNKASSDHTQNDVQRSEDNFMQYAEILYKCTLCTSLPSILTSKNAFVSHVIKEHLSRYEGRVSCSDCHLYFGTEEDIHAHFKLAHPERQMSVLGKQSHEREDLPANDEDVALKIIQNVYPLKLEHFNISKKRERTPHTGIIKRNIAKTSTGTKCDSALGVKQFLTTNSKIILNHTLVSTDSRLTDLFAARNDTNKKNKLTHPWFTPSFTPEFGKYTKLVREGGNIVYFCQVCNWKSQVKAPFQVHCSGKLHKTKAEAANLNEMVNPEAPVNIAANHLDNQQKLKHLNKRGLDHTMMLHNSVAEYLDHSKNTSDDTEKRKLFQNNSLLQQQKTVPQKHEVVRNRRKRSAPVPLRNFIDGKSRWSDSDSENSEHDGSTRLHGGITSETQHKVYNSFKRSRNLESNHLATDEGQLTSFKDNATKLSTNSSVTKTTMTRDIVPEDKDTKEDTENSQTHKSDHRSLEVTYKSIMSNNSTLDQSDVEMQEWSIKQEPIDEDDRRVYQCPRCSFSCTGVTNYETHFEVCYASKGGNPTSVFERDTKISTHAEGWKTSMIQQLLPELLTESQRGNVCRDLLLQKVSLLLENPEIAYWGPACNKAVRDMFPYSLAQRKGKYKKTYFFGVGFIDESRPRDEVNYSDLLDSCYQPLRDMSHDLEKILEYLPAVVFWHGHMRQGISRDEVLQLLREQILEADVPHWGLQCNRAVRLLFPKVEMKRKGKYKTFFYGIDFVRNISGLTMESSTPGTMLLPFRNLLSPV